MRAKTVYNPSMHPTSHPSDITILLPGPAGELETLITPKTTTNQIAIICHPHPLFSGTMHNKVVTTLSKTFQHLNMQTIRFNFRGVGKSTGSYADGVGEQQDLAFIIEWARQSSPQAEIWLAGFSFGAYISISVAAKNNYAGLVSIAPPVNHFAFDELPVITYPWIIAQGDQDDVVPAVEVYAWIDKLEPQPKVLRFPEAGHFFHGGLTLLKEKLIEELSV